MSDFSTTKLSSKGQVVIPDVIREAMSLKEGTQFMVFNTQDSIIFKTLQPPKREDIAQIMEEAQAKFAKAKVPRKAIKEAISSTRKPRKRKAA